MAIRGRTPKASRIRQLEGDAGKRPVNTKEPEPNGPAERPAMLTGEAAAEWDRAVGAMPPGVYTAADVPTLTVYCLAWASYRTAIRRIDKDGQTSKGAQGQLVAHPSMGIMSKQAEVILRASDRLGMSPSARTRLQVQDKPAVSKFDGLIGEPRGDLRVVK
jgi:P27 family predicted phage terminase small subunit